MSSRMSSFFGDHYGQGDAIAVGDADRLDAGLLAAKMIVVEVVAKSMNTLPQRSMRTPRTSSYSNRTEPSLCSLCSRWQEMLITGCCSSVYHFQHAAEVQDVDGQGSRRIRIDHYQRPGLDHGDNGMILDFPRTNRQSMHNEYRIGPVIVLDFPCRRAIVRE